MTFIEINVSTFALVIFGGLAIGCGLGALLSRILGRRKPDRSAPSEYHFLS